MSDLTEVQIYRGETKRVLQFAAELLKTVEAEDEWPGGWDPADVSQILDAYRPQLEQRPSTVEEAIGQEQKAREMLDKILGTFSGARGCVKLQQCSVASYFAECPIGLDPTDGTTFVYKGKTVRQENVGCKSIFAGPKI